MEKSELARICGIARQSVYNCMREGMSETDILLKYTVPINGERTVKETKKTKISKDRFKEGFNIGFSEGYEDCYNKYLATVKDAERCVKDFQRIREKITKIVLKYQQSVNKEVEFADINEIYEMVKEY